MNEISNENKLTALTVLNKGREREREREPQTPPESQLQSMIMREIPNILNLLKNDDNSDVIFTSISSENHNSIFIFGVKYILLLK